MNITINGDIYITNYGQTLDELTEGMEFDDFGEFDDCDCFEDFDEDAYIFLMDEMVDMYVDLLSDVCACEECKKDILLEFLSDVISLAKEFQE